MIKPSDAYSWSECVRRVWLDNFPERSDVLSDDEHIDPFTQLIIDRGIAHERAVLERLSESHAVVTAQSAAHTRKLMDDGVDAIYQPQFVDEAARIVGFPDFLIRLENGVYQAADAKLARREDKKAIQVQLGLYRKMLGTGLPAIVFLGDGTPAEIGDDTNDITDQFVVEMRALLESDAEPVVRYSHSKCRSCGYYGHCKPRFEAKQELSLLYGVQGRAANGLEQSGTETISDLASANADTLGDVPFLKGYEKKARAILQAQSYRDGTVHQTAPVNLPSGTWVHFDIESNPLTDSDAHVYLWGFLVPPYDCDSFEYVWTDNESEDRDGWIAFLGKIEDYKAKYPELVLAHYTSYEVANIKSYAERYGMTNHPTVQYLQGEHSPLFDMQKPVLESLVLPLQGHGLKDICKHPDLVNFQWDDESSGSQWSVVQFYRFLTETESTQRQALKNQILGYNRDDVFATRKVEEWLRNEFM